MALEDQGGLVVLEDQGGLVALEDQAGLVALEDQGEIGEFTPLSNPPPPIAECRCDLRACGFDHIETPAPPVRWYVEAMMRHCLLK